MLLWKFLRLRNSAWDFLWVNFWSGFFWGFCWNLGALEIFLVLSSGPIRSSLSLEIWSTPTELPSCIQPFTD